MQTIWATRLLLPRRKDKQEATTHELIDLTYAWIRRAAAKRNVALPENTVDEYTLQPPKAGVQGAMRRLHEPTGWRSTLIVPVSSVFSSDSVSLRTDVEIRLVDRGPQITLRRLVLSPTTVLRPLRFAPDPPSLITEILTRFDNVFFGSVQMGSTCFVWPEDDIAGLVDELTSPDREAPILLISHLPNGALAYDPDKLASVTAGLAQVVVLPSYRSAYDLTQGIGNNTLSCYQGAIRIYWPGFSSTDQPLTHRYWTPDDIYQTYLRPERRTDFSGRVLEVLSEVSALRVGPDTVVFNQARRQETSSSNLVERLEEGARQAVLPDRSAADKVAERDLLNEASVNLGTMENERTDALEALEDAENRLLYYEVQHHVLQRRIRQNLPPEPVARPTFDRLPNALEWVIRHRGHEHIVFARSAMRSARQSPIRSTLVDDAAEYLEKLCEVALAWGEKRTPMFKEAFVRAGYAYRGGVSDQAAGEHEDQYTFQHEGVSWTLGPHIKTGKGNPELNVSIYWAIDNDSKRLIVGHVGRHLEDSTTG